MQQQRRYPLQLSAGAWELLSLFLTGQKAFLLLGILNERIALSVRRLVACLQLSVLGICSPVSTRLWWTQHSWAEGSAGQPQTQAAPVSHHRLCADSQQRGNRCVCRCPRADAAAGGWRWQSWAGQHPEASAAGQAAGAPHAALCLAVHWQLAADLGAQHCAALVSRVQAVSALLSAQPGAYASITAPSSVLLCTWRCFASSGHPALQDDPEIEAEQALAAAKARAAEGEEGTEGTGKGKKGRKTKAAAAAEAEAALAASEQLMECQVRLCASAHRAAADCRTASRR